MASFCMAKVALTGRVALCANSKRASRSAFSRRQDGRSRPVTIRRVVRMAATVVPGLTHDGSGNGGVNFSSASTAAIVIQEDIFKTVRKPEVVPEDVKLDTRAELLAGFTVALTLIPETVAFALVCGVSPVIGLYTTIFGAAITNAWGGRPGMLSGAGGALAVVSCHLVRSHGPQYLFACVILMGLMQVAVGAAKVGKFTAMVPVAVVSGFSSGLALLIARSQLHEFKIHGGGWAPPEQMLLSAGLVLVGMAIIHVWHKFNKVIPPSLVCIAALTAVSKFSNLGLRTVADQCGGLLNATLPSFHIPQVPFTMETLAVIAPYAAVMATIGIVETALTKEIVDNHVKNTGDLDKANLAQGLSNLVGGLFSTMGSCAMIVPSNLNTMSGGKGRLSGLSCAAIMLSAVLFLSKYMGQIPMVALVAVLWSVCLETFGLNSWKNIRQMPRYDAVTMIAVTLVTLTKDLASGVFVGVIISALTFTWQMQTRLSCTRKVYNDGTVKYTPDGPLFFGSSFKFSTFFDAHMDAASKDVKTVIVDMADVRLMDGSAVAAVDSLVRKYIEVDVDLQLLNMTDKATGMMQELDCPETLEPCIVY